MKRSAVDILVDGGRRRLHGWQLTSLVALVLTAILGIWGATCCRDCGFLGGVLTAGFALCLVLPFVGAADSARILEPIRRSGFLAEVLLTRLTASYLFDQLAWKAVVSVALPAGPFLLLSLLVGVDWTVFIGLLGVLLGTLAVTYLAVLQTMWKTQGVLGKLLLWSLVLMSSIPLGVASVQDAAGSNQLRGGFLSLLLLAIASRSLAVWSAGRDAGQVIKLSRWWRPCVSNPYLRSSSRHPIVYREATLRAGSVPGGFVGAAVYRLVGVLAVLLLPACVYIQTHDGTFASMSYWVVLEFLGIWAGWRAWRLVVRDRPHADLLRTTPMRASHYVDGLARCTAAPVVEISFLALAVLAMLGFKAWCMAAVATAALVALVLPVLVYASLLLAAQDWGWGSLRNVVRGVGYGCAVLVSLGVLIPLGDSLWGNTAGGCGVWVGRAGVLFVYIWIVLGLRGAAIRTLGKGFVPG